MDAVAITSQLAAISAPLQDFFVQQRLSAEESIMLQNALDTLAIIDGGFVTRLQDLASQDAVQLETRLRDLQDVKRTVLLQAIEIMREFLHLNS
ncbi:MAG: hypothetical protein ACK55I_24095, partial [bacterium]